MVTLEVNYFYANILQVSKNQFFNKSAINAIAKPFLHGFSCRNAVFDNIYVYVLELPLLSSTNSLVLLGQCTS